MGHDHAHSHGHQCSGHDHDNSHAEYGTNSHNDDHDHKEQQPTSNIKLTEDDIVKRRLMIATVLCAAFLMVEVVGGLLSKSLAILSDAAHLLADLTAFITALAASHIASLPATSKSTYGFKRAESLAAFLSMFSLALVSLFLAVEAIYRLWPEVVYDEDSEKRIDVDGKTMTIIAAIGVCVNISLAIVLKGNHFHLPSDSEGQCGGHSHEHSHDHSSVENGEATPLVHIEHADEAHPSKDVAEENINLRAAYLHVLGDLAMSVAVLVSGIIIYVWPHLQIVDPICTLIFTLFVFKSTIPVIRSSLSILLNEVPPKVEWLKVFNAISSVPGVYTVHDLHIWSISHGVSALSVHCYADDVSKALLDVQKVCSSHGIKHATIQVQPSDMHPCVSCGQGMESCHINGNQ